MDGASRWPAVARSILSPIARMSADTACSQDTDAKAAGVVAAFHRKLVFLDGVGDRFGEIGEEFFEPLKLDCAAPE